MQACAFERRAPTFQQENAVIFGVSGGGEASKAKFIRDNKFNNIQLLIDENNSLRTLWQVPTTLGFLPGRVTYVINLEGRVIATHNAFLEAEEHTDAALKALTEKKA